MDNHVKNKKYGHFVSISSLVKAQQENLIFFTVLVYGHVYIIRSYYGHIENQNKMTDFLMILEWASPFKHVKYNCLSHA